MKILFAILFPLTSLFANVAYVGHTTSPTLTVIDTETNSITGTVLLGSRMPVLIAITPNNLFAYVTAAIDSVAVVDTATNTVTQFIVLPAGSGPIGIAITPDGKFVYVANQGSNSVSVISTATNLIVDTINSTDFYAPWGIAITPDGKFAYLVNGTDGVSPGYVSVIDLSTNTVLPPMILVGNGPTDIAITPDGQFAYVTNQNSNTFTAISIKTNTPITIPVGQSPFEVAANTQGEFVYVSNNGNPSSISVISTKTNHVVQTIPLSNDGPSGLATTPDGQKLFVCNVNDLIVISTGTNEVTDFVPTINTSSIAITGTLIADLTGQQKVNDFAVVYECYNQLAWQPTPFSDVTGYIIYRNGEQIATVSAKTFEYIDNNQKCCVPVTYQVAPIEASGVVGTPLSVVVG